MNQFSTSEMDLGFGTIGSKNGGIPNISKIGGNTRPVGGVHIVAHYCSTRSSEAFVGIYPYRTECLITKSKLHIVLGILILYQN